MDINPLTWLVDKILQACDARTKVRVLAHQAFLTNDSSQTPYYFVKVTNLSPDTALTITHVWAKDGSKEVDIINPNRRLPHTLEKTQVWETWFPKKIIANHENILKNIRVVSSSGKVYKSRKNKKVRPAGFIAG